MDAAKLEAAVAQYVRPATFPIGVRMFRDGEALPTKAKRPKADFGVQIATCQAITMARRYGWAVAVTREDLNCALTRVAFGYDAAPAEFTDGCCACGMYTETMGAGARSEAATPKFSFREYAALGAAPLSRLSFDPQVVILYGNSAQVMRCVAAALWKSGGSLSSQFSSRLDCADLVIATMQTARPQVILPCYGDRVFGQTGDDEMAFSLPASFADEFVAGLEGTHKGGIRYPIPTFLRYQPQFPESYQKVLSQMEAESACQNDRRSMSS